MDEEESRFWKQPLAVWIRLIPRIATFPFSHFRDCSEGVDAIIPESSWRRQCGTRIIYRELCDGVLLNRLLSYV